MQNHSRVSDQGEQYLTTYDHSYSKDKAKVLFRPAFATLPGDSPRLQTTYARNFTPHPPSKTVCYSKMFYYSKNQQIESKSSYAQDYCPKTVHVPKIWNRRVPKDKSQRLLQLFGREFSKQGTSYEHQNRIIQQAVTLKNKTHQCAAQKQSIAIEQEIPVNIQQLVEEQKRQQSKKLKKKSARKKRTRLVLQKEPVREHEEPAQSRVKARRSTKRKSMKKRKLPAKKK